MRRPTMRCDKDGGEGGHRCDSQGIGTLARVRRLLTLTLGGGQRSPTPSLSVLERSCIEPCGDMPPTSSPQVLVSLRAEAEQVIGRPLDEVMRAEEPNQPHGVPSFVHALCCFMLTHGVDYETLVSVEWCGDDIRSSLLEEPPAGGGDIGLSQDAGTEASSAACLLRLFLQDLPHPLLNRETVSALAKVRKDFDSCDSGRIDAVQRMRKILLRKLPSHNLNLLQYLTGFLQQLQTANHNMCPVPPSALSRVLARALTEELKREDAVVDGSIAHLVAEMLLLNHTHIFRDVTHIQMIQEQQVDYGSDSVSSTCDSRGDSGEEADLCTPDEDEVGRRKLEESDLSSADDADDVSTTTTTSDTDDFRSPPLSPLNKQLLVSAPSTSSGFDTSSSADPVKSTAELPNISSSFHAKISTHGKDCPQTVTDFISPTEELKKELLRSETHEYVAGFFQQNADVICLSGVEISELGESDDSRDADGSETEGNPFRGPCPHEERRTSERFLPRSHSSGGRRIKRKIRRRHSKDLGTRVPTSEEEEKETDTVSGFASLLSREDEEPATFDPSPPDSEKTQPFRDLLASTDPVKIDRSSWCLRGEISLSDNWKRTVHHYSREDDDKSMQSTNWYKSDDREEYFLSTKFEDVTGDGLSEDFTRVSRGHSAVKMLSKHISGIKKKIKRFEEDFEKKAGYRPSHQEKMKYDEIKKYMSVLSRMKKELKQMKDEMPDKKRNIPNVYPMSLLRCQESTAFPAVPLSSTTPSAMTAQDTLRQVEERLTSKRDDANRPMELSMLSIEQFHDEKIDLQKALLYYESKHGRPITREDRDRVRPLYDRYRQVKRGIVRLSSRSKDSIELAPILEHVAMDFTLASPQHRGSLHEEQEQSDDELTVGGAPINPDPHPELCPTKYINYSGPPPDINLGDLHALPIHELKERKREAREQKKQLRYTLRDFEAKFERETGRKMQKEDRGPMEHTYMEYKHVKAKLRLLEALLSKHSNSSSRQDT